jgi:hypothetical protein
MSATVDLNGKAAFVVAKKAAGHVGINGDERL